MAGWRAFRAHLFAAERVGVQACAHELAGAAAGALWAHELPAVELGACLMANPRHRWPRSFAHLDAAVVLITDVTPAGVTGLLLNRQTKYTVADQASVVGRVGKEFGRNVLHLGGDCSTGSLEMLHPHPPSVCGGARELVSGLSLGGLNASRKMVQGQEALPSDFHFFVAYARWTNEQLESEMARGAWNIVSCSPALLLDSSLEDRNADPRRLWNNVSRFLQHKSR